MPLTSSNVPPADRPMANATETADDRPGEHRDLTETVTVSVTMDRVWVDKQMSEPELDALGELLLKALHDEIAV